MVTHHAKPFGYIFGGSDVPGLGRSNAARGSRSAAAGKPASGPHRGSLPSFASGNLEAPAIAAPGASGARTSRRTPPRLSTQSRTTASCGLLARALPYFLEREPGQPESIRGGRTRKRNAGAQAQMREPQGNTATTFRAVFRNQPDNRQEERNEAMTKAIRVATTFVAAVALAATAARAQSEAQKSFNQLKSLNGTWEGQTPEGKAVEGSFRDTAGGSALMSE